MQQLLNVVSPVKNKQRHSSNWLDRDFWNERGKRHLLIPIKSTTDIMLQTSINCTVGSYLYRSRWVQRERRWIYCTIRPSAPSDLCTTEQGLCGGIRAVDDKFNLLGIQVQNWINQELIVANYSYLIGPLCSTGRVPCTRSHARRNKSSWKIAAEEENMMSPRI